MMEAGPPGDPAALVLGLIRRAGAVGEVSNATAVSQTGSDSLGLVELIVLIEDAFGVSLADIPIEASLTLGELSALVADRATVASRG